MRKMPDSKRSTLLELRLCCWCEKEAEYWTNPKLWTGAEVREAGIALDRVAELTRQLLYESKPKNR